MLVLAGALGLAVAASITISPVALVIVASVVVVVMVVVVAEAVAEAAEGAAPGALGEPLTPVGVELALSGEGSIPVLAFNASRAFRRASRSSFAFSSSSLAALARAFSSRTLVRRPCIVPACSCAIV